MQATTLDPVLDAPWPEAERQEIGAREYPMLRTHEPPRRLIPRTGV